MFAQSQRLDRSAFTDTYAHGRKVHMPAFLLVYAPAPLHKAAVVVGKKVARSAVARNTLKRRLYAALYEAQVHEGHIILITKPVAKAYSYVRLYTEIIIALSRVRPHSKASVALSKS